MAKRKNRRENSCDRNGRDAGPKFIPPNFFRTILRRFKISGQKIADPLPGYGSKAIAMAAEDNSYYYGDGVFSEYAEEMAKFLGVSFSPLDDGRFDVAFLDFGWKMAPDMIESARKWGEKADQVLLYVPRSMRDEADVLEPTEVQEVEVRILRTSEPDYLFLI